MIDANPLVPFFGVVEDVNDPAQADRIRVRVFGYNSENKGILPTDRLEWFYTLQSGFSQISGIGQTHSFIEGAHVFGFYIDPEKQYGVVLGAWAGFPNGKTDVNGSATGFVDDNNPVAKRISTTQNNLTDARGESWSEPISPYAPQYPLNRVMTTSSGHQVEFDDTPGKERICFYHKKGTFNEVHPDGKIVERNVGDHFEIDLSSRFMVINGNFTGFVDGDYRLEASGEVFIKSPTGVNIDTPVMKVYGNSEAVDHLSSTVSGAYHVHPGVFPGPSVTGEPILAIELNLPTAKNNWVIRVEDTGYTPAVITQGVQEGFLTQEDVQAINDPFPEKVETNTMPAPSIPSKPVSCGNIFDKSGRVDYNAYISRTVKLRDVTIGAVVSQYALVNQAGLTREAIACNLKNIAENVIEKLKSQFPKMMITSAFRTGSGKSQHERGEAIDIQFSGESKDFYYQAAVWIKDNVPFDQLLLEYKSTGSKLPWIHISLKKTGTNRKQVMTFFNHRKYADGLVRVPA